MAPRVSRDLVGDLEDHELVGPGGESAEPLEVVDPGQDLHHRVVGALLRDIVELRARERGEQPAAAVQLVKRGALQDIMEPRRGLLVARVVGMELLDPSPRRAVTRRSVPAGRVRRGTVATHELIVVRRHRAARPMLMTVPHHDRSAERTMGLSWQQGPLGRNPNGQFLVPGMPRARAVRRAAAPADAGRAGRPDRGPERRRGRALRTGPLPRRVLPASPTSRRAR